MSMGRHGVAQPTLWVAYNEMTSGPRHRFYEKLNELLQEKRFDRQSEELCRSYYDAEGTVGRRSIAPGVYFRMHLIGYFEGIESERGIEWRCADSLSLRRFLGLELTDPVPDHSTLSRTRQRLPLEVHQAVFGIILGVVEEKGLLKGRVLGVDSTYLRADASMKTIVRRDTKESYKAFVKRLAEEAGIEKPTDEEARRLDRTRKGKKTSNQEWVSKTDADARVAKLKDGRTKLAYKPEHVVDLETGAIVGAVVHQADVADTDSIEATLEQAEQNLAEQGLGEIGEIRESCGGDTMPRGPAAGAKTSVVADKGYHKAALLGRLKQRGYRTYIPERRQKGRRRWADKGGAPTAAAFYENQARLRRRKGKGLLRWRGEKVERTFAHVCETGGARRTRLRGTEKVQKRYLLQAAAANLGLVMRSLFGLGTPRGWAEQFRGAVLSLFAVLFVVFQGYGHRLRLLLRSPDQSLPSLLSNSDSTPWSAVFLDVA
jgi:transposase